MKFVVPIALSLPATLLAVVATWSVARSRTLTTATSSWPRVSQGYHP